MTTPLVRIRGATKRFRGQIALSDVDLTLLAGNITGLVGPDGSGKSTLIRMVAGLIAPDRGDIDVLGQPARIADRNRIGYMPQTFGLYENLTVDENVRLYADLRGFRRDRLPELDGLLEQFDLSRARDRRAGALSGGMRQKLSLVCTILHEPELLLLDEPAVGLDPISRAEIWTVLRAQRNKGVGILWSTAYLDEAERCDSVCLLRDGGVVYDGTPARLAERMMGRVFQFPVRSDHVRDRLREAIGHAGVTDGSVQGADLRLSFRTEIDRAAVDAVASDIDTTAIPVTPTLEDGFIDLVGMADLSRPSFIRGYRDIPSDDRPAIEAVALTKRYGQFTAADSVSFAVRRGEVFGLLGPNGAGKSTVFKMLCGLVTPSEGIGRVDGHDLRRSGVAARQAFGYMAQRFSLYGDLSVQQNLEYFAGCYGLSRGAARAAIAEVIAGYHLEPHVRRNAGTLPLGFKQRLALACAVMHQPSVLFLDEPTSGVDPILRREFWAQIDELVRKGVAVLVTTHFMDEAERCDRIAIIHQSRQIAAGTPAQLKAQAGCPRGTMEESFVRLLNAAGVQGLAA